jgi:curved DNA-binding protein CbpA
MHDPYEVLGIDRSADDETIKKAYLSRVRVHSPDRAPAEFKTVRAAYEAVRTEKARVAYELFHRPEPDLASLWHLLVGDTPPLRPDATMLRQMLAETLKRYRLPSDRLL